MMGLGYGLLGGGAVLNAIGYGQGADAMAAVMAAEDERQQEYLEERKGVIRKLTDHAGAAELARRIGGKAGGMRAPAVKTAGAYGKAAGVDAGRIGKRVGAQAELKALPQAMNESGRKASRTGLDVRKIDLLASASRRASEAQLQAASHTGDELRFLGQLASIGGQGLLMHEAWSKP